MAITTETTWFLINKQATLSLAFVYLWVDRGTLLIVVTQRFGMLKQPSSKISEVIVLEEKEFFFVSLTLAAPSPSL